MSNLFNVYDLRHPSPASLKHFACNAVALDLWRCEIKHYLKSDGTFHEHDPQRKTSLQCLSGHVPPKLYSLIERYADCTANDVYDWMCYHNYSFFSNNCDILNHFTDFVCDQDGKIDYAKTAKRIMHCDQVSVKYKFVMAGFYCLEDEVLRLGPKVSLSLQLAKEIFTLPKCAQLHYWVHRLRNELNEIALDESSVDEIILKAIIKKFNFHSWPCLEYFMNRLCPEARLKYMLKMFEETEDEDSLAGDDDDRKKIFYRYFLPKLDKETLGHLVATRGDELITCTLPTYKVFVWEYIKDKMTLEGVCRVVKFILREQTESSTADQRDYWCDLWLRIPNDLKRSVIPNVLENCSRLFDRDDESFTSFYGAGGAGDHREVSFLKMILSDTPVELRRTFWNENWHILMNRIKIDDLRKLVELCFDGDQSQIMQFKRDAISIHYKKMVEFCSLLLCEGSFEDLEDLLVFLYHKDELAIRDIRLKLLHENFSSVSKLIRKARPLNEFIDKAYLDNVNRATYFKNEFFMPPRGKAIKQIVKVLWCTSFRHVMDFIDTFTCSDAIATLIKEEWIVPEVVALLHTNDAMFLGDNSENRFIDFENFMKWLLRTENKIARFKETLNVDKIVLRLVEKETDRMIDLGDRYYPINNHLLRYCFQQSKHRESPLKIFLKWYFVSVEKFEEFCNKYADNEVFVGLISKTV